MRSNIRMSVKSEEQGAAESFSEQTHYIFAGVYALLAFTAFSLNTLVLVTFVSDRSLRTPSNKLILSMAVGDWLHAVLAYPFGIVTNVSKDWRSNTASCLWYAFITTLLSFGVMLHHATFAIERAGVIRYSIISVSVQRKVRHVIIGLWLFALLWSIFPLAGWSAYAPEGSGLLCSIRWQSSDPGNIAFIACIFFFFFIGPIVTMATAYYCIYHTVKNISQNAHDLWGENAAPTLEAVRGEHKTARMAFTMSLCFIFAWTPYAIVSLYAVARVPRPIISPLVASLPAIFAKTAACYNPILYFLLFRKFRVSLLKTLRPLARCRRLTKQDEYHGRIEFVTNLTGSDKDGSKGLVERSI